MKNVVCDGFNNVVNIVDMCYKKLPKLHLASHRGVSFQFFHCRICRIKSFRVPLSQGRITANNKATLYSSTSYGLMDCSRYFYPCLLFQSQSYFLLDHILRKEHVTSNKRLHGNYSSAFFYSYFSFCLARGKLLTTRK